MSSADIYRLATNSQPTSNEGTGGLLGGLGGLLDKLQQGGLGKVTNSWIGSGQNQPVSPNQVGSALGPNIIKKLAQQSGLSEDELTDQATVAGFAWGRRQADP